jgi:hypothetical protein
MQTLERNLSLRDSPAVVRAYLQTDAVSPTSYSSNSEQANISLSQHWRPILAPMALSHMLNISVDVHRWVAPMKGPLIRLRHRCRRKWVQVPAVV